MLERYQSAIRARKAFLVLPTVLAIGTFFSHLLQAIAMLYFCTTSL